MTNSIPEVIMDSDIQIPNKSFFKQDEVCSLTGVKPYVLRFWETEFEEISPVVSMTGQKLYEHGDIESILKIKKFLFVDKMTVEKARMAMKNLLPVEEEVIITAEPVKNEAITPPAKSYWDDLQTAKNKWLEVQAQLTSIKARKQWMN